MRNYRDCGHTCNPHKFEIPALRFPCRVPVNPCKHLQCTTSTTLIENGRSGGSHPFNYSFSSCIFLSKKNPDFLLRLLTSITNFKFLACVKHVEGKLCFYRIYHIVHSETRQKLFLSARIKLNYHIFAFLWGSGIAGSPTIYLHLIFEILQFKNSSLMNWIFS